MVPRQRTFQSTQPLLAPEQKRPLVTPETSPSSSSGSLESLGESSKTDQAKRYHDLFNLVALIPIIVTSLSTFRFQAYFNGATAKDAFDETYFMLSWSLTSLYFFVDLVWVASIPECVKSPGVIIKHHIAAFFYILGPYFFPEYRWLMAAVLSVEVNTWFLIMRRIIYKGASNTAHGQQPSVAFRAASSFVTAAFYSSWIVTRVIIYPALLIEFLIMSKEAIEETGILFHLPMIYIPVHAVLCLLNFKWTVDLFSPIVKKWLKPGTEVNVASGL